MSFSQKTKSYLILLLIHFCALTTSAFGQNSSTVNEQAQQIKKNFKNDYFSFGILLQGLADFKPERISDNNGFSASKGRFKISGIFDGKFGYKLQATMLKSPSVLDANVYFKPIKNLSFKAGLFKSPFTNEYLTGAGSILFVNRSTVVNQLGTKRQLGLQIDGYTPSRSIRFTAGIFNGNGFGGNNNDDKFLQYIGRIEGFLRDGADHKVKIGANIAYEEKNVPGSGNLANNFVGKQTLLGGYVSISQNNLLLDGEFIYGWRFPNVGQNSNPYGYYLTAGYYAAPKSKVLVRWDSFAGDNLTGDSKNLIAGFNYAPNKFTKIKLNYVLPTDSDIKYSNFLAVFQVGF